MNGEDDGVERTPLDPGARARYFPRGVRMEALRGIGHFPQREAPGSVARAILD